MSNAPVAARSKLIRIYEALIATDLTEFLGGISAARLPGAIYKRIIGRRRATSVSGDRTTSPLLTHLDTALCCYKTQMRLIGAGAAVQHPRRTSLPEEGCRSNLARGTTPVVAAS